MGRSCLSLWCLHFQARVEQVRPWAWPRPGMHGPILPVGTSECQRLLWGSEVAAVRQGAGDGHPARAGWELMASSCAHCPPTSPRAIRVNSGCSCGGLGSRPALLRWEQMGQPWPPGLILWASVSPWSGADRVPGVRQYGRSLEFRLLAGMADFAPTPNRWPLRRSWSQRGEEELLILGARCPHLQPCS